MLREFDQDHEVPTCGGIIEAEWHKLAWGNLETNLEFLRRAGLPTAPADILEIGCGKGAMLRQLRAAGHRVTGIDVDGAALSYCRQSSADVSLCVASGDRLPFADGAFDTVLSFDLFEHIRDSDRHLTEVRRVLKPNGRYLLQTPNKWTNIPFELLRQWRKYGTGPLASYREVLSDHCALHSYWQLGRRFARHGFATSHVDIPVVNEYFRTKMRTYLGALGPLLLTVFNPDRFPRPARTNFYVIATAQ
jgi:SAM-dependent methyltransferase